MTIAARADLALLPASPAGDSIFVEGLEMAWSIGVHPHERLAPQRVRIGFALAPVASAAFADCRSLVAGIEALARHGHVALVETLAERIAALCLADARIASVRVRVEKLDVLPEAAAVGVEIERCRASG